jgi:predicted Zn-dependent protease/outer membrane lipoprotein-sorting protein
MTTPELLEFIRGQLVSGATRETITSSLVASGWELGNIEEGFRTLSGDLSKEAESMNTIVEQKPENATLNAVGESTHPEVPVVNSLLQKKSRIPLIVGICSILALLIGGGASAWYWQKGAPERLLAAVLEVQQTVKTYESEFVVRNIEKSTEIMSGIINVDLSKNLLGGETTIPKLGKTQFVFDGKHYYAKLSLENPLLREMLKLPEDWIIYDLNDPTAPSKEVLLGKNSGRFGSHAFTVERWSIPEERTIDGKLALYLVYDMKRDEPTATGTVELWVDKTTYTPLQMQVRSGGAELLWHITKVNTPVTITPPTNAISMTEMKTKQFLSGLSKEKITEVAIYRGAGVSKTDEDIAVKAVLDYYGIKAVTFAENAGELPKQSPVYDVGRKQYNADAVWEGFGAKMAGLGGTKRVIVLLSQDTYSSVSPLREYVFSRTLPGVNTMIVSLHRLKTNLPASGILSEVLISERISKVVARTLGVSVGLAYSEDAKRKECMMYQSTTVEELDQVGTDICGMAKEALPLIFAK